MNIDGQAKVEEYQVGDRKLIVTPIPIEKGCESFDILKVDDEEKELRMDPNVRRIDDSLIFQLNNRQEFVLSNELKESEVDNIIHIFQGKVSGLGYWEVLSANWKESWITLVSLNTGEILTTFGRPRPSPEGNYMICGNFDPEGTTDINGFELFEVVDNVAHSVGVVKLKDWGPTQVLWLSESKFMVKRGHIHKGNSGEINYSFVDIEIVENTK